MSDLPFVRDLDAARDRVTSLLGQQNDSLGDVGTAALRAYGGSGTPGTGFADQIGAIRKENLGKAKMDYEIAASEEDRNLKKLDFMTKRIDALAKAGDQKAKATVDGLKLAGYETLTPEVAKLLDDWTPTGTQDAASVASYIVSNLGSGVGKGKAPTIHEFTEGDETVAKQFDPKTNDWVEVSRGPKFKDTEGAATALSKLIAERDKLPEGSPNRALYDQRIMKEISGSGMELKTNPDGTFTLTTGAKSGLTPTTKTDIQKKIIGAREGLARVANIKQGYKPEYQQIPTRAGMAWSDLKARFTELPDEEKSSLQGFADFQRSAIENINLYIKEITGAQMSEAEAERLRLAQPDPGQGIFGGDSPPKFEAKLDSTTKALKLAAARYTYTLKNGLDPLNSGIPLESMPAVINKRGDELKKEVDAMNPDTDEATRAEMVKQILQLEFGLM